MKHAVLTLMIAASPVALAACGDFDGDEGTGEDDDDEAGEDGEEDGDAPDGDEG
jgi:hypothetical protein